jgi:alcohol dehydrogenase (cytochrome c)
MVSCWARADQMVGAVARACANHVRKCFAWCMIRAYDDKTLDELWRINVGSGFNAPPMTYAVNGKQYIAIASGLCCAGPGAAPPRNTRGRINRTPELRMQGNATVVWVFGL